MKTIDYDENIKNQLSEMVKIGMPCVLYGNTGKTKLLQQLFPQIIIYDSREITESKSLS